MPVTLTLAAATAARLHWLHLTLKAGRWRLKLTLVVRQGRLRE